MAAFRRTDRVGAARIVGLGNGAVVFAFAVDVAKRMDGYEVDDVETESRYLGEARDAVVEARAFPGDRPLAARKHFVPCGKTRRLAVDDDLELAGIAHHITARLTARHQLTKL